MADIAFSDLQEIIDGLNTATKEPHKDQSYTVADLERIPVIYLSHSSGVADRLLPTEYWGQDRSLLDRSRYWFGKERPNATKELRRPTRDTISKEIFSFFENPAIRRYITLEAHQNGFLQLASYQIIRSLGEANLGLDTDSSKERVLEFRKDTDGSILVFETIYLGNEIRNPYGEVMHSSAESVAKVVLCTRIREKEGRIAHEIEYLEIDPGKSQQNRKIWDTLFQENPSFTYLKKYMVGTEEYVASQKVLRDGKAQKARVSVDDSRLAGAAPSATVHAAAVETTQWDQLGWNCFDLAVGIPGGIHGRHEIVEYALAKAGDEEHRILLGQEIRNAAVLTAIYMNRKESGEQQRDLKLIELFQLSAAFQDKGDPQTLAIQTKQLLKKLAEDEALARNTLPPSMHTEELRQLVNAYADAHEHMRDAVAACNDALGYHEGNRLSLEELDVFFRATANQAQYPEAYLAFSTARNAIYASSELAFHQYCVREDIYKQYVQEYYGKQQWFAFQRNFAEERQQTSMVDIVARKLGVVIVIYQDGKEIYRTTNVADKIKEITYDGHAHFVEGRAVGDKMSAREEERSDSATLTEHVIPAVEIVSTSPDFVTISPVMTFPSPQVEKSFAGLKEVMHRLNNPAIKEKGEAQTLKDLKRAEFICLSSNDGATKRGATQSWWSDYRIGDVLGHYVGWNRANKTQVFSFPDENAIRKVIFPFFDANPSIREYIIQEANQNCMGRAAESEVVNRVGKGAPIAVGFKTEGSQTKLEFRKEADGSILVFNTYCFPNAVNLMYGKQIKELTSTESIATATLVTRIRADGDHISHEIESFEIIPGKSQQSKTILEQLYKYEPQFAELKQYVVGTPEYAAKQGVLQDSQSKSDGWELINVGSDGATISQHILDADVVAQEKVTQTPGEPVVRVEAALMEPKPSLRFSPDSGAKSPTGSDDDSSPAPSTLEGLSPKKKL